MNAPRQTLKYIYPEQQKQYAAVIAFIAILFILGSILVIFRYADLSKAHKAQQSVQGISTQVQSLNQKEIQK